MGKAGSVLYFEATNIGKMDLPIHFAIHRMSVAGHPASIADTRSLILRKFNLEIDRLVNLS